MRLLLTFVLCFFSFFYLGDLLHRLFKISVHNFIGVVLMILGFAIGFWGDSYLYPPLDSFVSFGLLGAGGGLAIHHLLARRYLISERAEINFLRRHESKFDRFLEMFPGILTWVALTSPFWLSILYPFAVAYLILVADAYWLLSSLRIAVLIMVGYKRVNWAKNQPWLENLKKDFAGEWDQYYLLIALPTYNDKAYILGPVFEAIANSNFPKERIILSLGFEERAQQKNPEIIEEVREALKKYESKIGHVFETIHPLGLPGEIPGPGTNRNWMLNNATVELKKLGIKPDQVFVTTLDVDFVMHPEFLAGALHKYLSQPADIRNKRSYTGVFFYHNNYWESPTPMRLIATGTSFWQMAEMVGSDKYQNYSSLSMNLQSMLDVGLWFPDKVNDDSGFYWKAYYHFKGDYKVIPHYMPISADTVLDESLYKSFINQYQQLKRWAYGVEHIPYIVKQYFKRTDIDFWDRTDKLLFVLWANMRWGFLALFVTFAGLAIPLINPHYSESVVAINLPVISSFILTTAFLGLFATIYVHEKTSPPRPKSWSILKKIWSYMQLLLVPLVLVSISTIPAIDAQTSLMMGRYIEFRTTVKSRSQQKQ